MEPQGRILDGNLETLGLQATLKMLALGGKTGVLSVHSGPERLTVFLESGKIVDLDEPGAALPDLVDMFRLLGRIPRPQAAELRRLPNATPAHTLTLLQQMGIIAPMEAQQRAEFRIIQAISRAVRWERGRFEFHRDISTIQSRVSSQRSFDVDHVLLEALRLADEWGRDGGPAISRNTVARWVPEFNGDVAQLNLGRDDIGVLCLSNGHFPLYAVAFALLIPEPSVAMVMRKLLELGLIEVVDAHLEIEMESHLAEVVLRSQEQFSQRETRPSPEKRMLALVRAMGICVNGLLEHHGIYARPLRGRGEISREDAARYLTTTCAPLLTRLQIDFPRMDEVVRFIDGRLNYQDVESLHQVVRGQELTECYWDAVGLLSQMQRLLFDRIVGDEVGRSRGGKPYEEAWNAYLRDIDEEITRLTHQRAAAAVQAERAGQLRPAMSGRDGQPYTYGVAQDAQRRFS
ncbi:MAG: hypothetical protein OJF49_001096 [Ktedonobacterales bacterium]|jgi:hypothetical protein|nr:MAG: hypothetical protein OJF49_001096 [Ktedonobacterales bacterium]